MPRQCKRGQPGWPPHRCSSAQWAFCSLVSISSKNSHPLLPRSKVPRAGGHHHAVNVLRVKTEDRRLEQADASPPRSPGGQPSQGANQTFCHSFLQLGSPPDHCRKTGSNLPTVCMCVHICVHLEASVTTSQGLQSNTQLSATQHR